MTAIDIAEPMLEKARRRAQEAGARVKFDLGDVEYLPYEDACFDVLLSNFGLVFAPDHANVAAELARVTCGGGRVAFTAWKPNSKLGELYRRFTDEPIEGREAYEWGREDHVEAMLGEDFELEFEDGTLWIEADSGEEIWQLFSESAPPVVTLLGAPRRRAEGGVPPGVRRPAGDLPDGRRRRARPAPLPARPRKEEVDGVRGVEGTAECDVGERPVRPDRASIEDLHASVADVARRARRASVRSTSAVARAVSPS